jgi:hypothetical protein
MIILEEGGSMKKEWLVKNLAMGIIVLFIGMNTTYLVESHSIKDNSGISLITIQVEGELGLNNWYTSDVYFSFTKESEDIASIYYNNNNDWNEYIDPFVVHNDGEYSLKWYAVNNEGNTSDIDGPFSFNIDQTKPTITLEYEVTGGNQTHGWVITWTAIATDDTSGMDRVEFYQNDILQETVAGPGPTYVWVMLFHPAPNIFFKVIGYDKAGNSAKAYIEEPSNIIALKLSRFISGNSKLINIQSISNNILSYGINELKGYQIIEKSPTNCNNKEVFDPAYIIVVSNRKLGGNGWIVSNNTISFLYEDNRIVDVFYQINDEGWEKYTELLIISDDGAYSFSWYVVDSEGYTSTPESTTFKIDQTPPKISIIKKRIAINQVKIIANVYDNLSNIDRVDFSIINYVPDFTDYDFPYEWIWTGFFNQKVYVTVYDKAGNSARDSTTTQKSHSIQQSISQQINQLFQNLILHHQMRNI